MRFLHLMGFFLIVMTSITEARKMFNLVQVEAASWTDGQPVVIPKIRTQENCLIHCSTIDDTCKAFQFIDGVCATSSASSFYKNSKPNMQQMPMWIAPDKATLTIRQPAECSSYATNTDATRRMSATGTRSCDRGLFGSGTWVRFDGPAGTTMPTSPVSVNMCGTDAPGWYSGAYPSSPGTSSSGTVCYNYSGNNCIWSNAITVTNCGSFFVFLLIDPPNCSLRYCTM